MMCVCPFPIELLPVPTQGPISTPSMPLTNADQHHSPFHSPYLYSPDLNVVTLSVLANIPTPHGMTFSHFKKKKRIIHGGKSGEL